MNGLVLSSIVPLAFDFREKCNIAVPFDFSKTYREFTEDAQRFVLALRTGAAVLTRINTFSFSVRCSGERGGPISVLDSEKCLGTLRQIFTEESLEFEKFMEHTAVLDGDVKTPVAAARLTNVQSASDAAVHATAKTSGKAYMRTELARLFERAKQIQATLTRQLFQEMHVSFESLYETIVIMCFGSNTALIEQMRNSFQHFNFFETSNGIITLWNSPQPAGDINFVMEIHKDIFEQRARLAVTFTYELFLRILRDVIAKLASHIVASGKVLAGPILRKLVIPDAVEARVGRRGIVFADLVAPAVGEELPKAKKSFDI